MMLTSYSTQPIWKQPVWIRQSVASLARLLSFLILLFLLMHQLHHQAITANCMTADKTFMPTIIQHTDRNSINTKNYTDNNNHLTASFPGPNWVSRCQKGKTNLDFTGARDSEWQWHQLGHMQACTSFQTDNHASTPPLCFLQAGCPSCRPTNSVKALNALSFTYKMAAKTS